MEKEIGYPDKGTTKMTVKNLTCPRCRFENTNLMASSPIQGAWEVYICNTCFYSWRSTEPEENTNPDKYPPSFRLTKEEIETLPVLPVVPPLR
jgi:hypothetical protein